MRDVPYRGIGALYSPARIRSVRVVIQRVSRASVEVGGSEIARIALGLLLLVGVEEDDGAEDVRVAAAKIFGLRLFPDADGKMNLSVDQVGGEVLVVSQFTLLGDATRGRRPSFTKAAPPEVAEPVVAELIHHLEALGVRTASGVFGASMKVELVNDGPVTLLLDVRQGKVVV